MYSNFRTYDGDTEVTIRDRRNFLEAIEKGDVSHSHDEIARISAFYASNIQQIAIPPPTLPPRPTELQYDDDFHSDAGPIRYPRVEEAALVPSAEEQVAQRDGPSEGIAHRVDAGASDDQVFLTSVSNVSQPEVLPASQPGSSQSQSAPDPISVPPKPDQPGSPQPGVSRIRPTPGMDYTTNNGPKPSRECKILVVDQDKICFSVIVLWYMEILRVWTANTGGPWIFREIEDAYLMPTLQYETFCGFCGFYLYRIPINYPRADIREATRLLAAKGKARFSDKLSGEVSQITDTINLSRCPDITYLDLWKYDYIIVPQQDHIQTINRQLYKASPRSEKVAPRILVLSMKTDITLSMISRSTEEMEGVLQSIEEFMTTNFGWQRPQRQLEHGPFRTAFVRIKVKSYERYFEHDSADQLQKAEQESDCGLFWTKHLVCKKEERILAIVGTPEKIAAAKMMIDEILIKNRWGHVIL